MSCVEALADLQSPSPPAPQRGAVLLVSTGRSDADTLCSVLEESHTRCTLARSYREAVTALGRDSFALVLCDERLPDGCWKDVLGRIAVMTEAPRLVMMASEPSEALYGEALNLGAWELLVRPIRREEALRIIDIGCQKFAGRRRAARAGAAASQMAAAG